VYQPAPHVNKAIQFEKVSRLALECGWLVFAVDEFDEFCSASQCTKVPKAEYQKLFGSAPPGLYQVANYSRHPKLCFVGTSRRPAQVAREITAQFSLLRVFRMTEAVDLEYFAGTIGETFAERLRTLEPYTYLNIADGCEPVVAGGMRRAL
jgi:hypothetical protein